MDISFEPCLSYEYLGLRPRIDPAQVPSPIAVTEIDRQSWESKIFMTLPGTYVPLCTSDFIAVDQGSFQRMLIHMFLTI